MWKNNEESNDYACMNRCLTRNTSETQSSWKNFCSLLKKDCQVMIAGKFFLVAFGSLLLYTMFINFGYINFMNDKLYNVYLYDPQDTQTESSELLYSVDSLEELNNILATDTSGVGIDASSDTPNIILYFGSEKADNHRADYALSLLHSDIRYAAKTVGTNTMELKQRKEISCELLFIEIVAVGFLGVASVLFKEKQMGVIRVHAVLPFKRSLFILSKIVVFLLSDLIFATLMTVFNVGFPDTIYILPAILVQTTILSLIMALMGFGCTMLLNDFKQFSLAYLIIAIFVTTPVFLSANTSIKIAWIDWNPFYQVYMGLKNAYFGISTTNPIYYVFSVCGIAVLFMIVEIIFHKEMGKED